MAGVAPLLEPGDPVRGLRVFRRHLVLEQEEAHRPQHPQHFRAEAGRIREVMRRDAAGDQVEALVGEREVLGVGQRELYVGDAPAQDELPGRHEHGFGEVGGDHPGDMGSDGQGGVAAPGGDVERHAAWMVSGERGQALQV